MSEMQSIKRDSVKSILNKPRYPTTFSKVLKTIQMEEIRSKRKQIENHDLTKREYMKIPKLYENT
jgi:hypothetical protein